MGGGRGNKNWAPVSEPGFLDVHIFRFSIIEICFWCKIILENPVVRYRGKIIKVSWIDPGQNEGFRGPFLVH